MQKVLSKRNAIAQTIVKDFKRNTFKHLKFKSKSDLFHIRMCF